MRFQDNVGYLRGCNAGLELVSAEAVLYLNNDVELAAGTLDAALTRLCSDPQIGAVGRGLHDDAALDAERLVDAQRRFPGR